MKFVSSMTILEVETVKLKPHPFSAEVFPNLPDNEYNALKNDIKEKGIREPLEILPDFRIIDGHHRHKAATELGLEIVPCVVHNLDERISRLYILTSNLLRRHLTPDQRSIVRLKYMQEVGIYDQGPPSKEEQCSSLSELSAILDVSERQLRKDLAYGRAVEKYPDLKGQPITTAINEANDRDAINERKNNLSTIPPNLLNGDALSKVTELPDGSITLLLTDPPYGGATQTSRATFGRPDIPADNANIYPILDELFGRLLPKLKEDAGVYIFTSWKTMDKLLPVLEKHFTIKNCIVWDKCAHSMGDLLNNYGDRHEFIIFAKKGNLKMVWETCQDNIIACPRPPQNGRNHPTEKPVELLKQLIVNTTLPGELVFDPFAGSGSTLVAAEELGRKWIGIEIDPEWHEVARWRIHQLRNGNGGVTT